MHALGPCHGVVEVLVRVFSHAQREARNTNPNFARDIFYFPL